MVQPEVFVPLLEESGRIVPVGRWVLSEACRNAARWSARGHPIDIAVNFSVRQLETDQFVTDISNALAESGIDPSSLIMEITETAIMRDAEATAERLRVVKELGVRIAIDDFGTGYSSLAYLRQFPVDALKIDRSFISAIADSPEGGALTRMLVQLGKTLGLETLAEGIEDPDAVRALAARRVRQRTGLPHGQAARRRRDRRLPRHPRRRPGAAGITRNGLTRRPRNESENNFRAEGPETF